MTTCGRIVVGVALLLATGGVARAESPATSKLAKATGPLTAFVPAGYAILAKAEGDLDGDGVADAAVVLRGAKEDGDGEPPPRILAILVQQRGRYVAAVVTDTFILCKACGGVFGDPFDSITITKGTVRVSHYGGSNDRWGYRHVFQHRAGDWLLIGLTTTQANSATGDSETVDKNLLTGDVIVTTEKAGKKQPVKKSKVKPGPLKKLRDLKEKDLRL